MQRPPLRIGTWEQMWTHVVKTDDNGKAISHRAQANFRDHDGQTRLVSAFGKPRPHPGQPPDEAPGPLQDRPARRTHRDAQDHPHLHDLWEAKFEEQIADGKRSPTSLDTYRRAIKNHVRPALGEIRIGEANMPRIDKVISTIKKTAAPRPPEPAAPSSPA